MKAELNNENKAKFFALHFFGTSFNYIGSIGRDRFIGGISKNWNIIDENDGSEHRIEGCVIKLNPLSYITDEDAIEVGKYLGFPQKHYLKNGKAFIGELLKGKGMLFNYHPYKISFVFDYLRSAGYALRWMGLSVDEMIEAGWIKLTD